MKKTVLFLCMLVVVSTIKAADFVVEDFESKTLGSTLGMKAWNPEDGNATIVANPTNASNKAVNIVTSNYDAILKLNVSLPSGTTLSDYDSFSFDIYIPSHSEDANPNYKNMNIYIDDVKKYEDEGYPKQAEIATWTTKTYTIASLGLTSAEGGKNSFTIAFGISTNKGNYFIDNVKFSGEGTGEVQPPVGSGSFVVEDFEAKSIGATLGMKAWSPEDGSATVAADPANASNKVVNIVTSNYDAILKLNVSLPSGTTLSDYDSFSFDIYIPSNSGDDNPNYKNMNIYIDDVKKYEDEGYPEQAKIATWTTKTYTIASLGLTSAEGGKNSFTIAFGISTDKGNYFIDNVKFNGGGSTPPPPSGGVLTLEDFEAKAIGATLGLKAWYPEEDGSATVVADPANASNKVANIVTSNWDALLKLSVVLPSGKTLGDYEELLFDIYVPSNDADENPNYKSMNIYIDEVKKYEDEGYPKQADIATWTTKTYVLNALDLTSDEKAKSSFSLAIGMSTDKGNYYLDNIKLKEKTTGITHTATTENKMYVANNILYLQNMQADNIAVFNLNGVMQASGQGVSSLDLSHLNAGIYIVKAIVDGKTIVSKIIK